MSIEGHWDVTIKTPIGTLPVLYAFTRSRDGVAGTATYKMKPLPCNTLRAKRPTAALASRGDSR